ncbi:putative protein 2 [Ptychodera flava]|uniref:putative protein 2 n=1 Tax=Ptychodera flava TaxID=63121 RepID=UPI003969DBC0
MGPFSDNRLFYTLLLVWAVIVCVEAQFDDARCKCVCPTDPDNNQTRSIYIRNVLAEQCTCAHIVQREEKFCLLCECRYEIRNTTTIKVMVIFVVTLISVLFVYMLYLLAIDPILCRKRGMPKAAQPLEEETEEVSLTSRRRSGSYFSRMGSAQQRWKHQVQEQKKNVFDRHAMLS